MEEKEYYKVIYDDDNDNEVIYFIYDNRVLFTTGDSGVDYELNSENVIKELYDCLKHIMYRIKNKQEAERVCKKIILLFLLNKYINQ